jgi:hypothetical protein
MVMLLVMLVRMAGLRKSTQTRVATFAPENESLSALLDEALRLAKRAFCSDTRGYTWWRRFISSLAGTASVDRSKFVTVARSCFNAEAQHGIFRATSKVKCNTCVI